MDISEAAVNSTASKPVRVLKSNFVLAVTVGGIIGLGILRSPGEIAAVAPNPYLYLSLWLGAGLFVLLTLGVVAELIGMTPRSGGVYALVRHAYGPFSGFVLGWADWVAFTADIAIKAVVIVEFTAILFPELRQWLTPVAILVTTAFAAFQLRGIVASALIQETITSVVGMAIVIFSLLLFFAEPVTVGTAEQIPVVKTGIQAWSLVIATIIFTYDGWLFASYFSGEIKGGAGAVARTCVKGTVIVIVLYMLINLAMVVSIPLPLLADNELALSRALELAISPVASTAVVFAAIVILLSQQNQGYMGAPRVLQALATDGLAVKRAKTIGQRGNPIFGVVMTWVLSVAMIMAGGFEFLVQLCVFLFVPLYVALIIGIFILRKREPDTARPFRAWGHPYSTVIVLIGWSLITAFQAYADKEIALYAVGLVAFAWPVYWYLKKKAR
ncbi:MAG: APC family permease [Woeseiaceae bacterium]